MAGDLYFAEHYRDAWLRLAIPELRTDASLRGLGPRPLARFHPAEAKGIDLSDHPTARGVSAILAEGGHRLIESFRGVTGVALSLRYEKGEIRRDEPCLTFYVEREEVTVPTTINGLPTDVVVAGVPALHQVVTHQSAARVRPPQPGCSISHPGLQSFGTFGCVVKDRNGPRQYVLSCAHVLSDGSAVPGDPIIQPGTGHHGTVPADVIASFTTALPLGPTAVADAAIAEIDPSIGANLVVRYLVKPAATLPLTGVGLIVQKSGERTGLTAGMVVGIKGTIGPYNANGVSNIFFNDAIVMSGMSEGGDSGSILMDYQQNAIGVIFGGLEYFNSCGQWSCVTSWCTPIETVLQHLNVELVP